MGGFFYWCVGGGKCLVMFCRVMFEVLFVDSLLYLVDNYYVVICLILCWLV